MLNSSPEPMLPGMPQDAPRAVTSGYLYLGMTDEAITKPGMSGTHKGVPGRVSSHRKDSNSTFRLVVRPIFIATDIKQAEAEVLELLHDYRMAGREWFDPFKATAGGGVSYFVDTICKVWEGQYGADMYLYRVRMAQVIAHRLGR